MKKEWLYISWRITICQQYSYSNRQPLVLSNISLKVTSFNYLKNFLFLKAKSVKQTGTLSCPKLEISWDYEDFFLIADMIGYTIGNLKNPLSQNHVHHMLWCFSGLSKAFTLGARSSSKSISWGNYKLYNSKYPLQRRNGHLIRHK